MIAPPTPTTTPMMILFCEDFNPELLEPAFVGTSPGAEVDVELGLMIATRALVVRT